MTNAHGFLPDSSLGGMPPLPGLLFPGCTGCLAWLSRRDLCFKGFPESDLGLSEGDSCVLENVLVLSEGYDSISENVLVLLKCYDSILENVLVLLKGYDSVTENVLVLL